MSSKIYHLECEPDHCEITAIMNGLPFFYANGVKAPVLISKPINSVLIGRGNVFQFTLIPPLSPDLTSVTEKFSANIKIKLYDSDDVTGPEQGDLVIQHRVINEITSTIHFDNEYFDFSSRLINNDPISQEEAITYAKYLASILRTRNSRLILEEFKEKLNDYAIVYGDPPQALYQSFVEYIENQYLANSPRFHFSDDEIVADPWCEGRLWEISVGPERLEFILSSPDSADIEYVTKVFVGKAGNLIKVIR